jgi:hypothetical protein
MALEERDCDKSVEGALRQLMREGSTSPKDAACLDGETIAAWAERALRAPEAERVERHLAECARCSAMLATFVRTMPEPHVPETLWNRFRLGWLIPLATAAAAVTIWFAIPTNERFVTPSQSTTQLEAKLEKPAATPPAQPSSPAAEPSETVGRLARKPASLSDSKARSQDTRELLEPRTDTLERNAPAEIAEAAPPRGFAAGNAAPSSTAAPNVPPPAAVPNAPSPAGAERGEADRANAQKEESVAAPVAIVAGQTAAMRSLGARQTAAVIQIVSPNPANRWRIAATGRVEFSTSTGARWDPATLPASGAVIAGVSPAPSVCWLVGRGGTILLTTDGQHFARVPFPQAIDLLSIQATDARNATVTTADRRTFRTTDGGATWNISTLQP